MKPLPRYFIVDGTLVKVMRTRGKISGQTIVTGKDFPPAIAMSKGKEITEKEFILEKTNF